MAWSIISIPQKVRFLIDLDDTSRDADGMSLSCHCRDEDHEHTDGPRRPNTEPVYDHELLLRYRERPRERAREDTHSTRPTATDSKTDYGVLLLHP